MSLAEMQIAAVIALIVILAIILRPWRMSREPYWWCRRCQQKVRYQEWRHGKVKRPCGCATSPSPWELRR